MASHLQGKTPEKDIDPYAPHVTRDPYLLYEKLRRESPIYWDPVLRLWILTRMDDVKMVLDDDSFRVVDLAHTVEDCGTRVGKDFGSLVSVVGAVPFFQNGDRHRRSRRSLGRVLTRISMRELELKVEEIAGRLARDCMEKGEFDLVTEYAERLPAEVMAHILGLEPEDVPVLMTQGHEILRVFEVVPPAVYGRLNEKCALALELISTRIKAAEAASIETGLTIYYGDEQSEGDRTVRTAASNVFVAFFVGTLTTSSLIAFCVQELHGRAGLYRQARHDPALAARIVSEAARLHSPVQRVGRVATEERVIGGKKFAPGDRFLLMLGAANRDPAAFPDPDDLVPARAGAPDVVFGSGAHICVGAALARMEARIALENLLRLPEIERLPGKEGWYPSLTIRRLTSLPVRLSKG